MTLTINQIVEDAFRPFGEPQEGGVLTGHQTQRGLALFNQMMADGESRNLTYTDESGDVYSWSELGTADTFPLEQKYRKPFKYWLSKYIAEEFGYPMSPQTLAETRRAWSTIYMAFGKKSTPTLDSALVHKHRYF